MLSKLSLCVPTINRSHYLERALKYYSYSGMNAHIIIGDSSDSKHKKRIKELIKQYSTLNIEYIYADKSKFSNDAHVLHYLKKFIKTPYVTFAGDDDFLVKSGAEKCVEFLDSNPDFMAAHGVRLNYILNGKNEIVHVDTDEGYEWIKENAYERWLSYMRTGIATVSFIHRKESWEKQYALVSKMDCRYVGTELIICSVAAIMGKVKKLYDLSLVFQRETPDRLFSFRKYTLWDLINSPNWYRASNLFVDEVSRLLKLEGFSVSEEVKKEFWYHCLNILVNQFNAKFTSTPTELPTEPINLKIGEEDPFYPIFKVLTEGNI